MRKSRTHVQDARAGIIRGKGARDSREQHKGFRGQLGHRYFAGRIRRHRAIRRHVIDKITFVPITCRGVVVEIDPTTVLSKGAPKLDSHTYDLRKLGA